VGYPPRWPRDTLLSANICIKISPTCGGRSVGIFRLRNNGHGVCLFVCFVVVICPSVGHFLVSSYNKSMHLTEIDCNWLSVWCRTLEIIDVFDFVHCSVHNISKNRTTFRDIVFLGYRTMFDVRKRSRLDALCKMYAFGSSAYFDRNALKCCGFNMADILVPIYYTTRRQIPGHFGTFKFFCMKI
jgi:hypothetical protein